MIGRRVTESGWAILLIALVAVMGAGRLQAAPVSKLHVVATTSIIGDWVKQVGGDDVELVTLIGPNGDPHDFEPAPSDSIAVGRADLIFENGLGLERWLGKLCDAAGSHATRVVLSRGIAVRHVPESEGERPNGAADDRDPHVWQSVKNATAMVGNLRDALVVADPSHASQYRARASAYIAQLDELDRWTLQEIQSIPAARRKLITSHDAFGYFGQRYGMDISRSALESVTTEAADPSARQIADVIDQIQSSGVPVIFLENIQNPRLMERIAAEANVKVGPPLFTDALGPAGSAGDSYIKMMRYNVQTLTKALRP